jgi:hypothetical protein
VTVPREQPDPVAVAAQLQDMRAASNSESASQPYKKGPSIGPGPSQTIA